jgi:hypothetical protein
MKEMTGLLGKAFSEGLICHGSTIEEYLGGPWQGYVVRAYKVPDCA